MSEYSLIAFDMDGTLLNSEKKITEKTAEAVRRAGKEGKVISLSTGRGPGRIRSYLKEFPEIRYAICNNGAILYDALEDRIIMDDCMNVELLEKAIEASKGLASFLILVEDELHPYEDFLLKPHPVEKVNFYMDTEEKRNALCEAFEKLPLEVVFSDHLSVEITNKGVTKGSGLQNLTKLLGIPKEQSIAVGDSGNDRSILETAGLGIAMGNADGFIKDISGAVVADCDHDGCAEAIDRYLLGNQEICEKTDAEKASMLKYAGRKQNVNPYIPPEKAPLIKAWQDLKFGLFIHWGIYSVIGKGEWAYFKEGYTESEYREIAERDFHPNRSAEEIAEEWTDLAVSCGMKYVVLTARHHDGFCLFDSQASYHDFTSMKLAPHTDYVRAFISACHKKGLKCGIYYSPMDWRFNGYFHPEEDPESAAQMKLQCHSQILELAKDYGKIDILWYDGGWLAHKGTDADAAGFWESDRLNRMLRSFQETILISPRSGSEGDFATLEGSGPLPEKLPDGPFEKCMSVYRSGSWGYVPEGEIFTSEELREMYRTVTDRGGNFLLNVGPDPNGRIPEYIKKELRGILS